MNIGLLGFGVVGRGVYDMLADRDDIRAAWVLCRRDLGELTARTTYDIQDILSDPAVDTVVEVMGGLHPAYEYVAAALRAGKNVVSSNKYLMCRYYDELNALAREHGAALRCTAAVGGGIPWLTNLEKAARANHISRVWGILNGTTNYIMDAMHSSDVDFADVPANFNLISMDGDRMGVQSFFGQGAGRYPTAYNVVQDLVDITRGVHAFYTDSFVPAVPDNAGVQHRYYVRTRAALPELAALAEGDWEGAVITQPVPVSRMHALMAQALEQDSESFFAALQ